MDIVIQMADSGGETVEDLLVRLGVLTDYDAIDECVKLVSSRTLEDPEQARTILEAGLSRGETQAKEVEGKIATSSDLSISGTDWKGYNGDRVTTAVNQAVGDDDQLRRLVNGYGVLYQARTRLGTFLALSPALHATSSPEPQVEIGEAALLSGDGDGKKDGEEVEVDDPWAETGDTTDEAVPEIDDPWEIGSAKSKASTIASASKSLVINEEKAEETEFPIFLSDFLAQSIVDSALFLASAAAMSHLTSLFKRHGAELAPYRYSLLQSLPYWVPPGELNDYGLLPRLGDDEREADWVGVSTSGSQSVYERYPVPTFESDDSISASPPKTSEELSEWFVTRVEDLDDLGMLDLQLAWVQHGASIGVSNLDALGEDLSLLSRLIYDANLTAAQHEKWTLATWRAATDHEVVSAYLSNSTASTIVADIRRLVLPYLYVLESRAERQGTPDSQIVERLLHDAILSLSLQKALPVFEASKATTPMSERLIRNDQNVARLALACLYGSDEREVWSTMSSIFECLPVWDVSGGDLESDKEATSTTLESIATFVRPTTSSVKPPTPKDLFIFFYPLPFASLSRALDILDVHLESGEILARWGTAVQLRFLLQSARDKDEQIQLAEKMVRRQSGTLSSDRWPKLWEDMCRLSGGDDALLRGAFGMLSVEDMMKVYLGGLLSSGSKSVPRRVGTVQQLLILPEFDVARKMIRRFEIEYDLTAPTLESVALATSRELYDNAETGNIHIGEMRIS